MPTEYHGDGSGRAVATEIPDDELEAVVEAQPEAAAEAQPEPINETNALASADPPFVFPSDGGAPSDGGDNSEAPSSTEADAPSNADDAGAASEEAGNGFAG